jgi:hypothetical protein
MVTTRSQSNVVGQASLPVRTGPHITSVGRASGPSVVGKLGAKDDPRVSGSGEKPPDKLGGGVPIRASVDPIGRRSGPTRRAEGLVGGSGSSEGDATESSDASGPDLEYDSDGGVITGETGAAASDDESARSFSNWVDSECNSSAASRG